MLHHFLPLLCHQCKADSWPQLFVKCLTMPHWCPTPPWLLPTLPCISCVSFLPAGYPSFNSLSPLLALHFLLALFYPASALPNPLETPPPPQPLPAPPAWSPLPAPLDHLAATFPSTLNLFCPDLDALPPLFALTYPPPCIPLCPLQLTLKLYIPFSRLSWLQKAMTVTCMHFQPAG